MHRHTYIFVAVVGLLAIAAVCCCAADTYAIREALTDVQQLENIRQLGYDSDALLKQIEAGLARVTELTQEKCGSDGPVRPCSNRELVNAVGKKVNAQTNSLPPGKPTARKIKGYSGAQQKVSAAQKSKYKL